MKNKGISHQFFVFLCVLCVSVVSSYQIRLKSPTTLHQLNGVAIATG